VIYVNAGATRPADIWRDRLNDDGRLILPLTSDEGFGENPEKYRSSGAARYSASSAAATNSSQNGFRR
jgi:protein-L-isoaspartate(D-aspartate) O-methyltransferase